MGVDAQPLLVSSTSAVQKSREDSLAQQLFDEYVKHGDLWYVVVRAKEYGYVVGITRDASVTVFNLTDKNKYTE